MNTISKIPSLVLSLLFYSLSSPSYAQSNAPEVVGGDGKKNLSGKWEVSCATEFVDKATIRSCELCHLTLDPNDKARLTMDDLEITFTNDSIELNREGKLQTVPYQMNNNTQAFSFTVNQKEFKFRVFYGDGIVILEDEEGLIVELKREDKKKQ
ncbi:MAG: hypothetical protein ABI723_20455 [Bacteroidia bacterium]